MLMDINEKDCSNSFKRWECNEVYSIKQLILLPENIFMAALNKIRVPLFADLMLNGCSIVQAQEKVNTIILTIYTARLKFLENQK